MMLHRLARAAAPRFCRQLQLQQQRAVLSPASVSCVLQVRGLKTYSPTVPKDGTPFECLERPKYRYGMTDEEVAELDETGRSILSLDTAARAERRQADITAAIRKCERFPGDTGSSEVQVAVLSVKIRYLAEHLAVNKKDKHSRRGFVKMTEHRKKLLLHLRRSNFDTYKKIIHMFQIRDVKYINRDL